MSRGDTCARGANIEGFCELNEVDTGCVDTPKKDWYLQAYTGRATALCRVHTLNFLVNLDFQTLPVVPVN